MTDVSGSHAVSKADHRGTVASLAIKNNFAHLMPMLSDDEQNALLTSYARTKRAILTTTVVLCGLIIVIISVAYDRDALYLKGGEEQIFSEGEQDASIGTETQEVANCDAPYWGAQCTELFADILGKGSYFVIQIFQAISAGILLGLYSGAFVKIHKRKNVLRSLSIQGIVGSLACAIRAIDPLGWGGQISIFFVEILHQITLSSVLTIITLLSFQWIAIDHITINQGVLMKVRNGVIGFIWIALFITSLLSSLNEQKNVTWMTMFNVIQVILFLVLTTIGFVTFWRLLLRMESYYVTKLLSLGGHIKKRTRILSYMCSFVVIAVAVIISLLVKIAQIQHFAPWVASRAPYRSSAVLSAMSEEFLTLIFLLIFAGFLWNSAGVSEKSKNNLYANGNAPVISPNSSFVSLATTNANSRATYLTRQTGFTNISALTGMNPRSVV